MATNRTAKAPTPAKAGGGSPDATAKDPKDATPKASALDALERDGDTPGTFDPEEAARRLRDGDSGYADTDTEAAPSSGPGSGRKRGPYRKRGTGRDARKESHKGKSYRTKASLEAENAELRAKVETSGPDLEAQAEQLAHGIAGALAWAGGMAKESGSPAWELQTEQCEQLGAIWGPILAPYLPTIGAGAPILLGVMQTAAIIYPNYRAHRKAKAEAASDIGTLGPGETRPPVAEGGDTP